MLFVMASRFRGIEEVYAFTGRTTITVSAPDTQQVIQNINLAGAQFQTGGMVHTALNTRDRPAAAASVLGVRSPLPLERAEKYELEHGLRGYSDDGLRMPRNVQVAFKDFRASDVPPDGWAMANGRLSCGRNARSAGPDAAPNDVCLSAYDPRTGAVDEPATLAISRNHFDFLVVNDRLCVHARAAHGMEVGGAALNSGNIVPIKAGQRIAPIAGRPDKLMLQVAFTSTIGSVDRITISRTPGSNHEMPRMQERRSRLTPAFCPNCGWQASAPSAGLPTYSGLATIAPMRETARASVLEPGSRFAERYEVIRKIGEGGMGIVYLAKDTQHRRGDRAQAHPPRPGQRRRRPSSG